MKVKIFDCLDMSAETMINKWLSEQGNSIIIKFVKQSTVRENHVILTIWYEEKEVANF